MANEQIPIQPVDKPIICNPYDEPDQYWHFDRDNMEMIKLAGRRAAGYWYKSDQVGAAQKGLFSDEQWDDLPLINLLRKDVRRWRESGYRGASAVTKDLLRHWASKDRLGWRLFFCQREAVEAVIYLNELRIPGRSSRTGFSNFELKDVDIQQLLRGERPNFYTTPTDFYPTLADKAADSSLMPLRRMGCKMATGSGKTVVMSMLIAWAFCNRGTNPNSDEFPNAVLVVCPNLTVKERLQVLRPENPNNYYAEFDIVPTKYRPLLQMGKVLVTNWHWFSPRSEHEEGGKTYAVVDKGPDTPETYARWVLGDLYERMPIMVLNDEGHHCWRPAAANVNGLVGEDTKALDEEAEEARVWVRGLDRLNNHNPKESGKVGISICLDLSATPFYIKGSGHPEGRPFPWLVSDFGLVDAIESGIVKIPRLPIMDTTGLPDPRYFKLWQKIREDLERLGAGNFFPGAAHKPKPESVWREAEGAVQQLAQQWKERFEYVRAAQPNQEHVPPVMIVVCDNIDIAKLFYEKVSGESEIEQLSTSDVEEIVANNGDEPDTISKKKTKTVTVCGESAVLPEFANTPARKHTLRIDSKLLAEAESEDPKKGKKDAAEALRKVVATVGKAGQPGEHVRCVVSVAMLTEGWDANNVTHILGIRAFGSQLLCEQVVGRGLRRLDYKPDSDGLLAEEYVDVYGIPFSVIPFKGRPTKAPSPEDKPKNHVRALPERKAMEIRFPIVEGYVFGLKKNLIRCDVDSMERLTIEPNREPTATFISATVGYREGNPQRAGVSMPVTVQDRHAFYEQNHIQTIKFQIAKFVVESLADLARQGKDARAAAFRLQSRHQLFPQAYEIVDEYVRKKVNFQGEHPSELGLQKYVQRIVERLRDRIEPDESQGEPPLMPVLNRYKPFGTTADVEFKTTRPCFPTVVSHINQVVADTGQWEQSAAFRMEMAARKGLVRCYAKNDHLGLLIPYEYLGVSHNYVPDYLVRLANGVMLLLEVKGMEDNQDKAKHDAARRWLSAVNNLGQFGTWDRDPHICRSPQTLEKQIAALVARTQAASAKAV